MNHLRSIALAVSLALGFGCTASLAADKAPKPAQLSKDDLDLWAFSTVNALAPGKSAAEFRTLPNLADEKKQILSGTDDESTAANEPVSLRFSYSDGMEIRVLDFGTQAFVTHLRVDGPGKALAQNLKIGATRAEVEAVLGRASRGGQSYSVYEGKTDVIRVFYTANLASRVEIDRGE